jgi:hypothetical protein
MAFRWAEALACALLFGHGLFASPNKLGRGDWDYFVSHAQAAYTSLVHYGQLPLYSPYHCGGIALFENFQSRVYSPSFALVLAFGPNWGARLTMLVWLVLGYEGTRRFARELGAGSWAARLSALAVIGNGATLAQVAVGHFGSTPYLLWPWWLLALWRWERELARATLAGGAWLALSFLEGGIYPLLHGVLLAGAFGGVRAVRERRAAPVAALLAIGTAALGLSAFVLIPSQIHLAAHPRPAVDPEVVPVQALWPMLMSTDVDLHNSFRFAGQSWRWHEYAAYVGPVLLAVISYACVRSLKDRRSAGWLLAALLFVLWALGDFAPYSPWALGHRLPLLSDLRASGRAMLPAIFCASIAAALVLRDGRVARAAFWLILVNLALVTPRTSYGTFVVPFDRGRDASFAQRADVDHFELLAARDYSRMTEFVRAGRGALRCYEPTMFRPGARARFPARAEYWLDPDAGSVRLVRWSPHELVVQARGVREPTTLLVNQNHHSGWTRSDGGPVVSRRGLLGTPVPAGDSSVVLRFSAAPFGWLCSASASVLLALLAWSRRSARRQPDRH